ncbi:uncharacterized protein [Montipora capricornis]|uniref:uncharacterized protein n=1 Tax=Montipora capricornis TaxID=246305 RepID=UPI0035F206B8
MNCLKSLRRSNIDQEDSDIYRHEFQKKKLDEFQKAIKAQYPGASVVNERYIKCVCGQEIQLNKARVAQSFARHWANEKCYLEKHDKQTYIDKFLKHQHTDQFENTTEDLEDAEAVTLSDE